MANNEVKTSDKWSQENEFSKIRVLDPDGWDRSNFDYSWYQEKITKEEFEKRLSASTCQRLK